MRRIKNESEARKHPRRRRLQKALVARKFSPQKDQLAQTLALDQADPAFAISVHGTGHVGGFSHTSVWALMKMGWPTGFEPATTSSTSLDSTVELRPPTG